MKNFLLKPKLSIAMVLEKKSLDPCKAICDMMVMKSRFASFRPSGWSPYDYPESERDNVNFEGWKKDEEVTKTTRTNQSGVAGLESLFSQSHKT